MNTLFLKAFHTEDILNVYRSWLIQELTPLKVTCLFNFLYITLVMIDTSGQVRHYKVDYTCPSFRMILLRFSYLFWNFVIKGREMRYEKLYKNHWNTVRFIKRASV